MEWMVSIRVLLLAVSLSASIKADFSDDSDSAGLLSMASELDTFLDNLKKCRDTHINCLKNGDDICEKSFTLCVKKVPMMTHSTMKSLGIDDDPLSYGLIPDKWKNGIIKAKNAIKDIFGKGKEKLGDLIKKGKVKIKDIITKIKTNIPDIIQTLKALPETMKKVPAKLKSLLEKIKGIPSIVYNNIKSALEVCHERRLNCIFGNSTAAKVACDLKYPLCVPATLSCRAVAGNVIKMCLRVFDGIFQWLARDIPNSEPRSWLQLILMPIFVPGMIICAGPSVIASGCILSGDTCESQPDSPLCRE